MSFNKRRYNRLENYSIIIVTMLCCSACVWLTHAQPPRYFIGLDFYLRGGDEQHEYIRDTQQWAADHVLST